MMEAAQTGAPADDSIDNWYGYFRTSAVVPPIIRTSSLDLSTTNKYLVVLYVNMCFTYRFRRLSRRLQARDKGSYGAF